MQYRPLKDYVEKQGGVRLSRRAVRERLVDLAVEEFPTDAAPENAEEVLRARMRIRIRREYGSVVATILISVLLNLIVKLITEWWLRRSAHRVLMEGWRQNALAAANIPPRPPAA